MRKQFVLPKTNTAFWQTKITRNRERDQKNYDLLLNAGWQVIVLWACNLTKDKLESIMQQTAVALNANYLRLIQNTAHRLAHPARLNKKS